MAKQQKISVLPKESSDSGWFATLSEVSEAKTLAGNVDTDWVVIGGGWFGTSAARRLAELNPNDSVTLVDAGRIGNNAAGRSAGFAIDLAHNPRSKNFADNEQGNINKSFVNRAGIDYLREAVETHNISCDWSPQGKIHSAATLRGEKCLRTFAEALSRIGEEYHWYNAEEMREITGSSHYHLGLFCPGTVLIQPAALLRGLVDTMPDNVTVYENTPVNEVIDHGSYKTLNTSEGTINAKKIILANNGLISSFGFYKNAAVPIYTYASMTRQLSDNELERLGGKGPFGLIPADPFGTTVRRTADNRIFIRNVYRYEPKFTSPLDAVDAARRIHQQSFAARFPQVADMGFEHSWGGALCLSQNNGGTVFGELANGVFGAGFCNGTGIAKGAIFGKAVAELASGQTSRVINILSSRPRPTSWAPKSIFGLAVKANAAYRLRKAGKEV